MHHNHKLHVQLLFILLKLTCLTNSIQEAWWKSHWTCQRLFPLTAVNFANFHYIFKCVQFKIHRWGEKMIIFYVLIYILLYSLNLISSLNNLRPWKKKSFHISQLIKKKKKKEGWGTFGGFKQLMGSIFICQ